MIDEKKMNEMPEMELSEFIADALVQIANGIRKANTEIVAAERKIEKNPRQPFPVYNFRRTLGEPKVPGVKFDIAVTASAQHKEKVGLFVAIANIGAGGSMEQAAGNEKVSRIQFEVGIADEWG